MPNVPTQTSSGGSGGGSGVWTRISARIVLMLGFAYAASWWANQRFYAHFGIGPQDVGLTPSGGLSDIIGAIVRLGLWVALALIVLGVLPVIAVSAAGFAIEAGARQGSGRRVFASIFAGVAGGTAFAAYGWLAGWIYAAVAGFLMLASIFAWWLFWPRRPAWRWSHLRDAIGAGWSVIKSAPAGWSVVKSTFASIKDPRKLLARIKKRAPAGQPKLPWAITLESFKDDRTNWAIKVLDVFSLVAVVGLLLIDLPDDASSAATCVVKTPGYAVRGIGAPLDFVHLILLDVYAQPATITWTGTPVPTSIDQNPFRGTYLGTSNGSAIIYEPDSPPRLLRLQASNITVTLNPGGPTCKAAN